MTNVNTNILSATPCNQMSFLPDMEEDIYKSTAGLLKKIISTGEAKTIETAFRLILLRGIFYYEEKFLYFID